MKTPGTIRRKIKTLRHRRLKDIYKKRLSVESHNCKHFRLQRIVSKSGYFNAAVCMVDRGDNELYFCDYVENAEDCPFFELRQTKEEIKKQFDDIMEDPDLLERFYRDIYTLKWVLDESEQEEEGFWKRIFKRKKSE